jgi:CheY-like chemotaxis protein
LARILLIDDEPQIVALLTEVLAHHGHHVMAAADGRAGLRLIAEHHPDLVITDIFLPEIDGLEVIWRLRDEPGLQVIALSGGGQLGDLQFLKHARLFGAIRTMAKPLDLDALVRVVDELLQDPSRP